jgi:hypothetical protein
MRIRIMEGLSNSIAEAYADDLNLQFKWNIGNVNTILNIIMEFGHVLGLELNFRKTQLMVTGIEMNRNIEEELERKLGGLSVVDKINILGIWIPKRLEMERLYENWERMENKIINLVRYW